MATAQIRTRGQAPKGPVHKKATIRSGSQVLTLPITSPAVSHGNLAPDWVTTPRSNREPLMRRGAQRQRQHTLDVLFDKKGARVENELHQLIRIAYLSTPAFVTYGPFEGGAWWITDLTIKSSKRELGSNAIIRAEVSLTLTAAPANSYRRNVTTPPAAKPPTTTSTKAPARPKSYVVKRGDTLTAISVRFYGDARKVADIARANKIRNPNRIYPGQRLVLP